MEPRLGIYIHIPFCASKCGYCDFYSCAGAADRMADYQHALLEHIEESAGRIAPAYIDTVYFGGGTPSFYGAARLIELLDAVKATGRLLKRAEVTVEVNPDSVRLHDLRALPVIDEKALFAQRGEQREQGIVIDAVHQG